MNPSPPNRRPYQETADPKSAVKTAPRWADGLGPSQLFTRDECALKLRRQSALGGQFALSQRVG